MPAGEKNTTIFSFPTTAFFSPSISLTGRFLHAVARPILGRYGPSNLDRFGPANLGRARGFEQTDVGKERSSISCKGEVECHGKFSFRGVLRQSDTPVMENGKDMLRRGGRGKRKGGKKGGREGKVGCGNGGRKGGGGGNKKRGRQWEPTRVNREAVLWRCVCGREVAARC